MPGTGREGRAALKKVPGPFQVGPVDMKTLKEPSFLEASAAPKHCCLALPNKDLSPQENSEYNYVLVSLSLFQPLGGLHRDAFRSDPREPPHRAGELHSPD